MATSPQIALRDGSGYTQNLVLSTNLDHITLTGVVDTSTVDMQVSVDGGPFTSDPTLVLLDGVNFTVPNPNSYSDGFPLNFGVNEIRLRSIDIIGGVSAPSRATVTKVAQSEGLDTLIPTGIRVERLRNSVNILASKPEQAFSVVSLDNVQSYDFRGFNFYASVNPGGSTGYFKVNSVPITTQSTTFQEDLSNLEAYNTVFAPTSNIRVRITQEDDFGNETAVVLDKVTDGLPLSNQLKFTGSLQSRSLTEFIYYNHDRSKGPNADQFVDVDSTSPLYYVVTAVYFDALQNQEFETPYSQEVVALPFILDTAIRDLPGRTQFQITVDYISAIQRVDSEISLIVGSTTRDVGIDPFVSEAHRLWFVLDFVHRSSSFLTLLQIDDANGDGVSDPVVSSTYKQGLKAALGIQTNAAVQQLIDTQFDKLASNFQKPRLPGRSSVGQAVLYTTLRPMKDIVIPSGTVVSADADPINNLPAVRFLIGGSYVMRAGQADAYYNFATRRYEITVDIIAETIGKSGNRSANTIRNISGSLGGLQVINPEATVFGDDRETNASLAARAMLGFVSVDSGTEGGYMATSSGQVGVIKAKIVKSGDPLMMRDYDDVRKKHIGGKVDVWVQGVKERTVTEQFAFTFDVARDIRCQIIDLPTLTLRVLDSRVTSNTPVTEILNNPVQGLGVRNVSTGSDYNLSGVVLVDYQTFRLNTGVPQPVTSINDIITVDYRFRSINQFTFTLQPVRRVVSVVGEVSGALDNTLGYNLYKTDDPLLTGESTIAKDYLVINQVGGVPTGASINVNDELHTVIGYFEEPLASIGINTATIRVFSQDRSVEYDGPGSANPDFDIVGGSATTPVSIVRTNPSDIVSGQTLSVDYSHDENFTVTYIINDILQQLQRTLNSSRHVTADVLAKQSILNSIDIESTAQLKSGASRDKSDPAARSALSLELNQKYIGQGVAQSDVINAIDSTEGIDFQVIPMARMGYADGSRRLRESLLSSSVHLPSLDIGGQQVFIFTNALRYPTTDGGGLSTEHKGVFQDDEMLVMAPNLNLVGQYVNQSYIIGSEGADISGYSDDATLISQGYLTSDAISVERKKRTANHVVVSLSGSDSPVDSPTNHSYAVSYVVRNDIGPHDIVTSEVETVSLGNFTLTIRS